MNDTMKIRLTAGVVLIAGLLGYSLGWTLGRPKTIRETPAPAVRQTDGSLVLERKPQTNPEPKHQLPAGSKLVRQVSVEVMPRTPGSSPEDKGNPAAGKTVTVDLSLVQMKDGTQRVVASSPDGEVVGGMDVPAQPLILPKDPKWTVSALAGYDIRDNRRVYGAMVQRTAGPFVVQAGAIGSTVFLGAGVRF